MIILIGDSDATAQAHSVLAGVNSTKFRTGRHIDFNTKYDSTIDDDVIYCRQTPREEWLNHADASIICEDDGVLRMTWQRCRWA